MISKFFMVIKKIVLSVLFLYAFNIVVYPLGMTIPINIINVLFVTFFDFPFIFGFCLFSLFIF